MATITVTIESGSVVDVDTDDTAADLAAACEAGDLLYTSVGDSSALWIVGQPGNCQTIEACRREHALWANDYESDAGWEDVDATAVDSIDTI